VLDGGTSVAVDARPGSCEEALARADGGRALAGTCATEAGGTVAVPILTSCCVDERSRGAAVSTTA